MQNRRNVAICLGLFILYVLGFTQYIADSEFWPITLAHEFGNFPNSNTSLYYKFLFHGLLKIPYYLPLSNTEHILLVKHFMALVGIGIIVLFYKVTKEIYHSSKVALCTTLLLLSTQVFFSQYSRIRSDLLVCFLTLISFWNILDLHHRKDLRKRDLLIQFSIAMISFLVTPKAIYWIILSNGFLFFHLSFIPQLRQRLLVTISVFLLPFSAVIIAGLTMHMSMFQSFGDAWVTAALYFKNAVLHNKETYLRLFKFDFFSLIVSVVSIVIVFKKQVLSKDTKRAVVWVTAISILSILFHTQVTPFFIAAILPFAFLSAGAFFQWVFRQGLSIPIQISIFFLFFLSKLYGFHHYYLYWHPNFAQIKKISDIEASLPHKKNLLIFDGIGILPRYRNVFIYIEPIFINDAKEIVDTVEHQNPDVIIWNSRSPALYPYLADYLRREFQELNPGVWTKPGEPVRTLDQQVPVKYYFMFEPNQN